MFMLPSICYFWYYAQPSCAPWAFKLSEVRRDHAPQILKNMIFLLLMSHPGSLLSNISVFSDVSCTLFALYWIAHGAAVFRIKGLFHTNCMFALYSLCTSAGVAQLSVCISPADHWRLVDSAGAPERNWPISYHPTPALLQTISCVPLSKVLSCHVFNRQYLGKTIVAQKR